MSSLEEVRNLEANAAADQFLKEINPGEEKLRQEIANFAKNHFHFSKIVEETRFVRDLLVIAVCPQEKSQQAVIDQVLKKLNGIDVKKLEGDILSLNEYVEDFQKLLGVMKSVEAIFPLIIMIRSIAPNSGNTPITDLIQEKVESTNELDKTAKIFKDVTAEEWKAIQQIFEDKKLPFSHDFVQRCQQVALKALAA